MQVVCTKAFTAQFPDYSGTCRDGCCSGLHRGQQDFEFEAGQVYEVGDDGSLQGEGLYRAILTHFQMMNFRPFEENSQVTKNMLD